jgi:DNA-binding protein H-NS
MQKADLERLSDQELWALHDAVVEILSKRLLAEKREMERRLAELERSLTASTTSRKPGNGGPAGE